MGVFLGNDLNTGIVISELKVIIAPGVLNYDFAELFCAKRGIVMSHKIVRINPGANYTSTTVNFDRSILQIQAMLEKHKCSRIAIQKDMRGDLPTVTLLFEKDGIPYIIEFPIIYEKRKNTPDKLRMDVSGRIIHDRIKALLIEVELNILDFSQGMMAFLAISDKTGRPQSLQDFVLDNKGKITPGSFDIVYQLPPGRS